MVHVTAGPVALVFGSTIPRDNSLVILQLINHMQKCKYLPTCYSTVGTHLKDGLSKTIPEKVFVLQCATSLCYGFYYVCNMMKEALGIMFLVLS